MISTKHSSEHYQTSDARHIASSHVEEHNPWYWFPSSASGWEGLDFIGRSGGPKDEIPWKIRASVIHSVRAHHGALRSLAVCQDECTVFTAGVGPGFKGTVQKWELARFDCVSGYYGHEEVCFSGPCGLTPFISFIIVRAKKCIIIEVLFSSLILTFFGTIVY